MSRANLKGRNLGTMVLRWYGPFVIAAWLVAVALTMPFIEFLLAYLLAWSAHTIVIPISAVLKCILWMVGWWYLHRMRRKRIGGSQSWRFQVFGWFVAARTLVAIYRVVLVTDRAIGFEIVPIFPPVVGGESWGLWGLNGLGIGLAILVLLHVNKVLDGAVTTTGGIAAVALFGALAMVGDGLQRVYEFQDAFSTTSTQDDLAVMSVHLGSLGAWIMFQLSVLILLIGAARRLKRFIKNRQCPRCRYSLIVRVQGCSECGWRREDVS